MKNRHVLDGRLTMGMMVRRLVRVGGGAAAPPQRLAIAEAPAPAARVAAGFTVEDLVVAINAGQRLQARIKCDGRFQVAGGAVTVELAATRETGDGPRRQVVAELVVRTLSSFVAKPLHVLMGKVEAMPPEGIVWDVTVDGSEVIRVGRQASLVTTIQRLRMVLSRRRVIL